MRPVKPVLQLIRLPNVFTAAADSLAGWLLVGGAFGDVAGWLPLAAASMALYAAGMALNDWFDLEVDRAERPGRPLPSGMVAAGVAAAIGWGGLTLGLALAALGGGPATPTFAVAAALAAMIVAYNAGLKHTSLGPWAMGSCRALNMLLGMASATALGGPAAWLAAGAFGVFVAGVTWISRSEARGGGKRNLVVGLAIQDVALLALAAVALMPGRFPHPSTDRPFPVPGLLALGLVATAVHLAAARALREPTPALIQKAVKTGVLSLVWLDVALVASARGPLTALAVAVLWIPAFLLARRLYAT
ncbi:UbiA family prenyltransferase [Paludisphaera mucosa]|uniref:UbiA family prenyltransferase n=1 Tax=Paludisphaera mucosa TaxID=3030827 RepID=A0ABT6FI81_9BACT|nr:UbiA family prenyltransferase [Paludisphaera mucosa]MDG3007291.1 UbiA family prenyltransferase [Paludisphaera mucosa]